MQKLWETANVDPRIMTILNNGDKRRRAEEARSAAIARSQQNAERRNRERYLGKFS